MKIIERKRFGSRGEGSLIRYAGVENWYSVYCAHGKEIRQTTGTADFKAAKKFHKGVLDALAVDRQGLRRFVPPTEARVTVGELVAALMTDYELRGVRSLVQVRAHLGMPPKEGQAPRTILKAFGTWRVGDLSAEAIDRYALTRTDEGAKPATVNRETQLLGQALRLAQRRGNLARVPEIQRLREDNARQGFFEAADYEAVVSHLPAHLQDVAAFGYLTGWRRGEILTLAWADVDRDGGMIRLRPEHSKNRRGRALALEGDLVALLEQRWQARVVKDMQGTPHVIELVFHRQGRPIVDFRKAWAAACAKAGFARPKLDSAGAAVRDAKGRPVMVPTKLVHDLRRTAARNLVRAGVPERVAMAVTGHVTRSMFDRYNIVAEDDLRSAMQRTAAYRRAAPRTATVTPLPTRAASGL